MAQENDLVLIYYEEKPFTYARIEDISADYKKDWYHVTLLLLTIPAQMVTWILRNAYINGEEYTMGGKRFRLELVEVPETFNQPDESEENSKTAKPNGTAKIISLADRRKS